VQVWARWKRWRPVAVSAAAVAEVAQRLMAERLGQPGAQVAPSPKLAPSAEPEGQRLESEAGVESPRLARAVSPAVAAVWLLEPAPAVSRGAGSAPKEVVGVWRACHPGAARVVSNRLSVGAQQLVSDWAEARARHPAVWAWQAEEVVVVEQRAVVRVVAAEYPEPAVVPGAVAVVRLLAPVAVRGVAVERRAVSLVEERHWHRVAPAEAA
jgi:hypothetical protein